MKIDDPVFIGMGFEWTQEHAQMAREIYARDPAKLRPPAAYGKIRELLGISSSRNIHGQHWVHGIGREREQEQFMEADDLYSHVGIVGTTGAGKGRLLEVLIAQAIDRGDAVIIIDPKLDVGMRDRAYGELKRRGREHDFLQFAPAYPEDSVRINPMQNYAAGSQLATRTISMLPASGRGDNFQAFAWKSINNVVQGMILAGDAPSIRAIRYLVEGNVENLFMRALERHMATIEDRFPHWRQDARNMQVKSKKGPPELWEKYLAYYSQTVSPYSSSEALEGLRAVLTHPTDHYTKMIVTIAPQLTALTTEEIGALLSPDYDDFEDSRKIVNLSQITRKGQVLYAALNALGDSTTAGWIGALMLSDLIAVAANRYNYENKDELPGVTVVVDELSSVANEPFIDALSRARGAGFRIVFGTQTIADLAVRYGDKDHAMQILGNVNSMFLMRGKDRDTKQYAASKLGTTRIARVGQSHSSSTKIESSVDFNRNQSVSLGSSDGEDAVPPELFDSLPDLHCFAALHDSRRLKLRFPFSRIEEELRYPKRM